MTFGSIISFMAETFRTFVALEINQQVRAKLGEAINLLRQSAPPVKWVKPSSIHITLAFLGETDSGLTEEISRRLYKGVTAIEPYPFSVGGLGSFGGNRPRVIWCGIRDGSDRITNLRNLVANSLRPIGFKPDERPFRPHLTLGRVRKPSPAPGLTKLLKEDGLGFEAGISLVEKITYFRSTLTPSGPIYESLADIPLGEQM
jgi:RNA 2',3'-cyclic 3'-phosphodiesterase